jgi:hypothetical protein
MTRPAAADFAKVLHRLFISTPPKVLFASFLGMNIVNANGMPGASFQVFQGKTSKGFILRAAAL